MWRKFEPSTEVAEDDHIGPVSIAVVGLAAFVVEGGESREAYP